MNAEMETSGIRSTIHPQRTSPMKKIIQPAMTDKAEAISWPGMSGWVSFALVRTSPTRVDITATGYSRVRDISRGDAGGVSYADGDIFRCSKEPVDENAHERGVESELRRKTGQRRICHTLRDDHTANGDAFGPCQHSEDKVSIEEDTYQLPGHQETTGGCSG